MERLQIIIEPIVNTFIILIMRKDRDEAKKLREEGNSYRDIEKLMKVPRSTLSEWFKEKEWSGAIKEKLNEANKQKSSIRLKKLSKIRGNKLYRIYERARDEARNEVEYLKYHPLFVAGLMLYWGEGTKTIKSQVRVANTDPRLLMVFIDFLIKIAGVDFNDIKASLLLYPDLSEDVCREYWAKNLNIPNLQIRSVVYIQGKHKSNRLRWGVCTVYVSSTYLKVKMDEWLLFLPQKLLEEHYYENI